MEVQTYIMHHNPYDIKTEEDDISLAQKVGEERKVCTNSDLILGNFALNTNFYSNNNHDHLNNNNNSNNTNNNNHVKLANGRSLTADRKRPYPCNICPSRFGSKMELEEHQNSHTGQKPFECDVCKARFNRRSTLWNHKRIHSDAKPFVCTVCQMTFKWKNSLKCHKEMHLRKNESSAHLDNDLRQLTYATAAKRRLQQDQEENGTASATAASIHSQPLITTTTSKKKSKVRSSSGRNSDFSLQTNHSSLSAVHLNSLSQQPLQASALIPPSDHQLDLDTSSLDTLVSTHNHGLLHHIYLDMPLFEMDSSLSRHTMLSGLDDTAMLGQLSDKSESPMTTSTTLNVHLPTQINMFNLRPMQSQLPSVHHLTSTSSDYGSSQSTDSNVSHPQYIVTSQPDMMVAQPGLDYLPNLDYQSNSYQTYQGNYIQQHLPTNLLI